MPDTVRSVDDLLNASTGLFKDNVAGDISAQDLRDFTLSTYRPQGFAGGRITTESGVSVSTSDRTSQSTIYYTPHTHNLIGLYDGTSWKLHTFTERSLSLSSLTSGKNYDVFLYDNSGTLTLELSAAWTTDTARADALTTQDGVHVKSGATTRRYLGTIRTTGTTTTEDSAGGTTTNVGGKRFVWNLYNRVARYLAVIDTTNTWSYNTASWRYANNNSGNRVEYVVGLSLDEVWADIAQTASAQTGGYGYVGVGVDTTSSRTGRVSNVYIQTGSVNGNLLASYRGYPGIGYRFLAWLEYGGAATLDRQGDNGESGVTQAGLEAVVWG